MASRQSADYRQPRRCAWGMASPHSFVAKSGELLTPSTVGERLQSGSGGYRAAAILTHCAMCSPMAKNRSQPLPVFRLASFMRAAGEALFAAGSIAILRRRVLTRRTCSVVRRRDCLPLTVAAAQPLMSGNFASFVTAFSRRLQVLRLTEALWLGVKGRA